MYYRAGKKKVMIRITHMTYRYVEDFDFFDILLELDGFTKKRIYVNSHRLHGLDMSVPDAVASLLRAKIDCQPVKGVEKSVDKR